DLRFATLADAVGSLLDALEGFVDRLDLFAFAVAEDEVDLAIALLAGEVVSVHPVVLGTFTTMLQLVADLFQDLPLHVLQQLFGVLERRLAHRRHPALSRWPESRHERSSCQW